MLPSDRVLLLASAATLLGVVRYVTAWRFFRANAATLRTLDTVPWPLRSKLARPSHGEANAGMILAVKLSGVLAVAPMMVGIALWLAPEQVSGSDITVAVTSLIAMAAFAIGDPIAMRAMRATYGVPENWKALLR